MRGFLLLHFLSRQKACTSRMSSNGGRPSSTEILLQRCVGAGEVTRAEADVILAHWKTTAQKPIQERSKDLQKFLKENMSARATAIWNSMTYQQQQAMQPQSQKHIGGATKVTKKISIMDELLRPNEGLPTVRPPEGGDRGLMTQELMSANSARQEAEMSKKAMYDSLVSIPGSGKYPTVAKVGSKAVLQSEIASTASSAAKEKHKYPVPTELNWSQFNVVDKDALSRIIQNVNAREGIIATAATGKLLTMAVQQQACRILAAGVCHNSSRQSKDTIDDYSRLMGLSERGGEVYSMSFGPDVYNDLARSEANCRQICRAIGEDGERVITEEKLRHEAYVANNITKPGKRKLEEAEILSSDTPWWIQEGQAEDKGLADWVTIAKLHVVDQVVGLDRSVSRRGTGRSTGGGAGGGAGGGVDEYSSLGKCGISSISRIGGDGSGIDSQSGSSGQGAEDKMKLINKIKAECPLVSGISGRDANVLTRQDIAGSVTATVKNIFPSNVGFGVGSTLGKGAVRAKLRINQTPGLNMNWK